MTTDTHNTRVGGRMQSLRESGDYWNYIRYLEVRHARAVKRRRRKSLREWAGKIILMLIVVILYKVVTWGVQWIKW